MKDPFFSIIIPTRNREAQLQACLQSLISLDYPRHRFEVIVVDDGSKRPPVSAITAVEHSLQLTLISRENAGPAAARNTGAAHARGSYLAFTDDDCMPEPAWLRTLADRFHTSPNCCIGGKSVNALSDNVYSSTSQLLIDYLFSYYNRQSGRASFLTSNNLAMPKEIFLGLNGFDTSFPNAAAEDREFCDRWLSHGYPIMYAPEVLIRHAHYLNLRTFWRQHYNYGSSALRFHRIRARRSQSEMRLEPPVFYLNLLLYPFRGKRKKAGACTQAMLLVLSQVANAAGFFIQRIRHLPGRRT
ncbi:glycosyltransferase [bacterium]|nr:glycosyltransferase [bacterium]